MAAQSKFSFMLVLCSRQIPAKANKLILSYLICGRDRERRLVGRQMVHMIASFFFVQIMGGAAASALGSAVGCRVEGRAIDTALGQCFIPNLSH